MKKHLLLSLFLGAAVCLADYPPPEGSGTMEDPYQLATANDILWLADTELSAGSYSVLLNDIDLFMVDDFKPIGTLESPFSGNIDGRGFAITRLFIDIESNQGGLFGFAENCKIENLQLQGTVYCIDDGGLLFGNCNNCTVNNVTLSGMVKGEAFTGLLAGTAQYLKCTKTNAIGDVGGDYDTGGLVGCLSDSTIENCYTATDVAGAECAGGIAGFAEFSAVNCVYASGSCTGNKDVGGIIGKDKDDEVTASFFDKTKARAGETGTGVTTEALLKKATYAGFDFLNVWAIEEGVSTPYFLERDDPFFWRKFTAVSSCRITLKGSLSAEDLVAVEMFQKIGLYTLEEAVFVTKSFIIEQFPQKSKEEKITYNEKKNLFRYTSKNQLLSIAYEGLDGFIPCGPTIDKCTIDFTGELAQGIVKDDLRYLPLRLCDETMTDGVLSGTAVMLDRKGNNLSYKSKTLAYKVNLKNGKFNAKCTLADTVQGIYGKIPVQE